MIRLGTQKTLKICVITKCSPTLIMMGVEFGIIVLIEVSRVRRERGMRKIFFETSGLFAGSPIIPSGFDGLHQGHVLKATTIKGNIRSPRLKNEEGNVYDAIIDNFTLHFGCKDGWLNPRINLPHTSF